MTSSHDPLHISELFDRLKASGWSIGSTAHATDTRSLCWPVDGRNDENVIQADSATESTAWWPAVEIAWSAGMLKCVRPGESTDNC